MFHVKHFKGCLKMTTYEKIYRALKDQNACKFNIGNQVFLIKKEQLIKGFRLNLYRSFFATNEKRWLHSFIVRDHSMPYNYNKCIREFLHQICISCTYYVTPITIDKHSLRSVRKANYIYRWRNHWDRDYNVVKVYDNNGIFCGWKKEAYLTW